MMAKFQEPRSRSAMNHRRGTRLTALLLVVAGVILSVLVAARPVGAAANGQRSRSHRHPAEHVKRSNAAPAARASWQRWDDAVYVVSTLNVPPCHGSRLATVLWRDGAGTFDVLQSTTHRDLYFIQVRTLAGKTLAVYAYQFGWVLPVGVRDYRCMKQARPEIVGAYQPDALHRIASFHTTLPSFAP